MSHRVTVNNDVFFGANSGIARQVIVASKKTHLRTGSDRLIDNCANALAGPPPMIGIKPPILNRDYADANCIAKSFFVEEARSACVGPDRDSID
jgi:hypothetical protein